MAMSLRLLRPMASSSFTPTSIASLQLWLDASDLATVFQNSDGTVAALADEDPVGYWADKSGNDFNVTQPVNNDRPTLSTSAHSQNGKPTVFFDGANDYLDSGVVFTAFDTAKEITLFVVMRTQGESGAPLALKRDEYADYLTGISFDQDLYGAEEFGITFGRGSGNAVADYAANSFVATDGWQLVTASVSAPGNSVTARLNKAPQSLFTESGTLDADDFLSAGSGGHRAFVGARGWDANNFPTFFHNGAIAEIVLYSAALSEEDTAAVENYLSDKWGLP